MKKTALVLLALAALVSCGQQEEKEVHKVGIVAHRGFWQCEEAQNAENSIASLKCAQDAGLWGSECDVHMTADEVIIVNHNNHIDGIDIHSNPFSAFADCRLANGETVPTFDEYLTQTEKCATTMLVLEIKREKDDSADIRCTDLCIEALKKHNLYSPDRVAFISFSPVISEYLAKVAPEFINQYLSNDPRPAEMAAKGVNGMDTYWGTVKKDSLWYQEARDNNMSFNIWTVNEEEMMKEFALLGVDQITTNYPVKCREVLKESGIEENRL